jgi:hypothetical protein
MIVSRYFLKVSEGLFHESWLRGAVLLKFGYVCRKK